MIHSEITTNTGYRSNLSADVKNRIDFPQSVIQNQGTIKEKEKFLP